MQQDEYKNIENQKYLDINTTESRNAINQSKAPNKEIPTSWSRSYAVFTKNSRDFMKSQEWFPNGSRTYSLKQKKQKVEELQAHYYLSTKLYKIILFIITT